MRGSIVELWHILFLYLYIEARIISVSRELVWIDWRVDFVLFHTLLLSHHVTAWVLYIKTDVYSVGNWIYIHLYIFCNYLPQDGISLCLYVHVWMFVVFVDPSIFIAFAQRIWIISSPSPLIRLYLHVQLPFIVCICPLNNLHNITHTMVYYIIFISNLARAHRYTHPYSMHSIDLISH